MKLDPKAQESKNLILQAAREAIVALERAGTLEEVELVLTAFAQYKGEFERGLLPWNPLDGVENTLKASQDRLQRFLDRNHKR